MKLSHVAVVAFAKTVLAADRAFIATVVAFRVVLAFLIDGFEVLSHIASQRRGCEGNGYRKNKYEFHD